MKHTGWTGRIDYVHDDGRERGREWFGRGIYTTAIGDFTEAIRRDGRNPEHFASRALAWEKKGDAEKARADRDKAARLSAGVSQR